MDDLSTAVRAAKAGASVVVDWFGRSQSVNYKAEANPVTEADVAAEQAILEVIRRELPDDDILAEEGGTGRGPADRTWIVDPLDGTVNFVSGIPQIGVSVALYEGEEPLVSVIVDPLRSETFTAVRGGGARLNDRPVEVSGQREMGKAIVATGFPYDHRDHPHAYAAVVGAVLARVQGIRRMGAASLDLAWVAAGRYDGFWELGLAPWDLAAGLLLIREAGGRATDPFGRLATPSRPLIVASNGHLHDELRNLVLERFPEHLESHR